MNSDQSVVHIVCNIGYLRTADAKSHDWQAKNKKRDVIHNMFISIDSDFLGFETPLSFSKPNNSEFIVYVTQLV